jgi:hypothetical protein
MTQPCPRFRPTALALALLAAAGLHSPASMAADEIVIEDGAPGDEIMIETDGAGAGSGGDTLIIDDTAAPAMPALADEDDSRLRLAVDDARLEYGHQTDGASAADSLAYGKLAASMNWQPQAQWELQLAGRVDGHDQDGQQGWSTVKADYGDSFVRYRGDNLRLTVGAQTVIWGRLDEIPLSDRVSTADLTRFVLDDLEDRRRANPMVRAETNIAGGKLDMVWLVDFRAAELPDRDSIWYPIDRSAGRILGIDRADIPPAVVQAAGIIEQEPDGDGGFGARYTRTHSFADIGVTLARTRQSTPYFRAAGPNFKTEYPRSWAFGADTAIDAAGATWRAELVYSSDNPVTRRSDLGYTTVAGVAWGLGVEMHPGDGNTRVNLQLVGNNLIDAPAVLDRTEVYSLNGEIDMPFDRARWRASLDFLAGLDHDDWYLNPEIAFLGWEPHEVYLALHWFDGSEQGLGGFHQDHSSINLGWRAKF